MWHSSERVKSNSMLLHLLKYVCFLQRNLVVRYVELRKFWEYYSEKNWIIFIKFNLILEFVFMKYYFSKKDIARYFIDAHTAAGLFKTHPPLFRIRKETLCLN